MPRTIARLGSVAAVLLLVTASAALAASGSARSSSSSISLQLLAAPTLSGSTAPTYGQAVTFNVSTNVTTQPFVHVKCFQSSLVYESWQSWWNGPQSFTLGGTTAWQGGAANCAAYLENWDSYSKNGKIVVLASTSFHVNA